jgi:chromosome segregation ATPase
MKETSETSEKSEISKTNKIDNAVIHVKEQVIVLNKIYADIENFRQKLQETKKKLQIQRENISKPHERVVDIKAQLTDALAHVAELKTTVGSGKQKDNTFVIQIAENKVISLKQELFVASNIEAIIRAELDKNGMDKYHLEKQIRELTDNLKLLYNCIINIMISLKSFGM